MRSFNTPLPGHLNFWRLPCSNALPSGQKSCSTAPPVSTEIPLLKDKFLLQSNTAHTFQREICRHDSFKLLLKTLLRELFTNKGEILSCKSVKPCKNGTNSRAYYARTRDRSGSNSPPFKGNVQSPPPWTRYTVKCPWRMFDLTGSHHQWFFRFLVFRPFTSTRSLTQAFSFPHPFSTPESCSGGWS